MNVAHSPVANPSQASDDPLLTCLALISVLLNCPAHLPALRTGFAVNEEGRIPLEAFPDLALKHGMRAAWSRARPKSVPNYAMPIIVPFIDGRACILRSIKGGEATVLMPETGMEELTILVDELEALSTGEILHVRVAPQTGQQQLVPYGGDAFAWFWGTLWRFKGYYVDSMVATLVANILTLALVFFSMNVYDRVVPTQAYTSLWTLAIGTSVAIFLEFIMRWLKARLVDLGGKKADLAINALLLREIMSIRLEHRPQSIGIFASSMRDFESLRDFFSSASLVLLADLPFAIMFIALIGVIAWPLMLIPAVIALLLVIIGLAAQHPMLKAMRTNMKESGDRQSVLVESVLNLELLKAHNAESYLQRRWEVANVAASESYKQTRALSNLITGLTTALTQFVTVAMIVIGVYLIHSNMLTLGGLIASVILAGRAIGPMGSIMSLASRYQQAVISLETLEGLMKRPRDRDNNKRYVPLTQLHGSLSAEDLEFAYPGEHKIPIIRRVTMKIEAGEHVALLGRIGSGKSTYLRLLAGLYTPLGGSLRVDDMEVQQIDPAELRGFIGYVGQDDQLFMGTLRENLVLSDSWISDVSILNVLKQLGMYEVVASHPRGMDMPLTEAGGGMSGGQRQMLAIARMMLREPSIVFMDEPTSHMDQNSEACVIEVMSTWLKGRTLVLATHRPQLLSLVDTIAVLERGVIVTQGPKENVLAQLSRGVPMHDTKQAQA